MQCNIAPLHAHENVSVPPWVICTCLYIDFAVINSLSLIFHECKKNMLFSPRCVSCAASECVRIFLCLAAQEKSLGASVAEGGGRWDMINFCPIEKKTLNGANKLSLGHGSKIDSVLFCSRVPGTFFLLH